MLQHPGYDKVVKTILTEEEATYALREAFKKILGSYPSDKSLSLLFAQTALETGRWKLMNNNNWGNIKWSPALEGKRRFTMFATGENLWDARQKKVVYQWFEPPHHQTWFRSYPTATEGAEDYIDLLAKKARYVKSWAALISGDGELFGLELSKAGYYTADQKVYTKSLVSISNEFMKKKDKLLAYKPLTNQDEIDTLPPPAPSTPIIPYIPPPARLPPEELDATIPDVPVKLTVIKPGNVPAIVAAFLGIIFVILKLFGL